MKKKSASRSAFFNLRLLFGVVILSGGAFLAVFAASDQRPLARTHVDQLHAQVRSPNHVPSGLSGGVRQAWVASYSGVFDDEPTGIAVDGSGNVYVTGYSSIPDFSSYATIKYNAFGQEEWSASYAGPNSINFAAAIAVDHSGNVYVTGSSGSFAPPTADDYATIKYNSAGQQQWVARYNGPGNADDHAVAIAVDVLGNVYVTGFSSGSGTGSDYATIKYDSLGQEQWVARYNGPGNDADLATGIAIDGSGNVYVTGGSAGDYATVKYDSAGQQQWVARYNGPGNLGDSANGIGIDSSGNVYVTGSSWGSDGVPNYATIKYNSVGQQQWVSRYSGPENLGDVAEAIAVSSSGNVYVTGESGDSVTGSDYATIKYDSSGQEQWVARYHEPENFGARASDIAIDRLGNAYVTGAVRKSPIQYDWDYATVKYTPDRTPRAHPRPTP